MIEEDIKNACRVLEAGGIILYPTDTVWGLGCDATNAEAVRNLYKIKQREEDKAMLMLVDSIVKVEFYVDELPPVAWDMADLSIKPLTIIYPKARNLAGNLPAQDGSIGIRVTKERFSHALCQRFRKGIVSTSANLSGMPTPANFGEISEEVRQKADYIVKYRQDDLSRPAPSSIVKVGPGGQIKIIRQ